MLKKEEMYRWPMVGSEVKALTALPVQGCRIPKDTGASKYMRANIQRGDISPQVRASLMTAYKPAEIESTMTAEKSMADKRTKLFA